MIKFYVLIIDGVRLVYSCIYSKFHFDNLPLTIIEYYELRLFS